MKNTHSFNFLLELIIVILFFTISSIVFVGLFAKAYQMNEEANIKADASYELQNLAEEFKMTGVISETTLESDAYKIDIEIEEDTCKLKAIYQGDMIEEITVKYLEVTYE